MNFTIPNKARYTFYAIGAIGAYGLAGILAASYAMGIHEPGWLLGAVAAWLVISGPIHQLAAGNVPDWSTVAVTPAAAPVVASAPAPAVDSTAATQAAPPAA